MKSLTFIRNCIQVAITAAALATSAYAVNFDLFTADAARNDGNPGDSGFLHIGGGGGLAGDMKDLYTATLGGNALDGFWVRIDFGGELQPILTSAFLKAADRHLLWDEGDLFPFNTGVYTSITLWNSGANGIANKNNQFHQTSHAGIYGRPGTPVTPETPGTPVPDGGLTIAMIGFALAAAAGGRRLLRR